MASTYSTNLGLELIATGEQSGTWGATTNANFGTLTEQAIVGYSTQAVTDSGSATVLTIANGASSTGRNYVIALTGALTAARTVEVPAVNKPYIFFNSTTGGFAVTVKVTGQTGVVIANGKKAIVYTNTTDVIEVANAPATEAGTQTLTNKTLTAPVIATIVNTGTLTLPTSTDTLVGRATTDTLTNKTLTSPLIGTVIGGTTASSSLTLQSTSGVGTTDSILFKVGNNGATTAMTVDTSGNVGIATGNLTFSGTGQRITGDFSSTSPISNRVLFQTSTTNATTIVSAIPNGTGTQSNFNVYNSSDAANASDFRLLINSTDARLLTAYSGTGTYLPMTFYTGGSEAMRIGATAGTDKGTVGIGYSALTGVGVNGLAVLGNVGIGTSSPTQKLHVNGGNILVGTAGSNAVLYLDSTSTYVRRNSSDGSLVFNNQAASNTIFTTNASETMRIDSSGNVGIGTSSPTSRVTVAATNNYGDVYGIIQAYNTGTSANDNASITVKNYSGTSQFVQWEFNGLRIGSRIKTNTGEGKVVFTYGDDTEAMRIDSSGNVGIGTSSPGNKLVVSGGSIQQYRATGDNSLVVQTGDTSNNYTRYYNTSGVTDFGQGNGVGFISVNGAQPLTISTNSAERMRIDSSGNVIAGASAALATTATNGFLYVPTCAGTPTGTPTTVTGMAPIVVNTTNNKLYFYSGGAWRDAGP